MLAAKGEEKLKNTWMCRPQNSLSTWQGTIIVMGNPRTDSLRLSVATGNKLYKILQAACQHNEC